MVANHMKVLGIGAAAWGVIRPSRSRLVNLYKKTTLYIFAKLCLILSLAFLMWLTQKKQNGPEIDYRA